MKPKTLVIGAACALLVGCGTASTGGGGGAPAGTGYGTGLDVFPFIEGARCVYAVSVGGQDVGELQVDHSLVGNTATARGAHVRLNGHLPWHLPAGLRSEEWSLHQDATGVTATDVDGNQTQLLALPLAAGTSWSLGGSSVSFQGTEDVSVPAGSFKGATKVGGAGVQAWLAPGTGVVRLVLPGTPEVSAELTSFTP